MNINRSDLFWNYASGLFKILSGSLLLPFILKTMSSEMVGVWIVFMTITAFSSLVDFGFNTAFTRNVSYIFSGVRNLKVQGYETVSNENQSIDFELLKGGIQAMRWIYLRLSILLFILLSSIGTWYIHSILQNYQSEKQEVYFAWFILCSVNTYNIYSKYYDALLQGKGLVKRSKQIMIVGQLVYLGIASILIFAGFGLIAIVSSQASSVIIARWLSHRFFFTNDIKLKLKQAKERNRNEILKAIYPNALKVGVTVLGKFMIQKSAVIIGSLYLTLEEIASFGISIQLINIIVVFAGIYMSTFNPKIAQLRVKNDIDAIKKLYINGKVVLFITYIFGGTFLIMFGEWGMNLIDSKTHLMSLLLIVIALLLNFEQSNRSIAAGVLLTKNEVPFYKTYLISGIVVVIGLFLFFKFSHFGLLTLLIVPLIVDLAYQAWKWPLEVKKELNIQLKDYYFAFNNFRKFKVHKFKK